MPNGEHEPTPEEILENHRRWLQSEPWSTFSAEMHRRWDVYEKTMQNVLTRGIELVGLAEMLLEHINQKRFGDTAWHDTLESRVTQMKEAHRKTVGVVGEAHTTVRIRRDDEHYAGQKSDS